MWKFPSGALMHCKHQGLHRETQIFYSHLDDFSNKSQALLLSSHLLTLHPPYVLPPSRLGEVLAISLQNQPFA